MATKNNTAAENVESFEVAEETAVPRQSKPEAKVTSIKKNEEPEFYGDDVETGSKLNSIVKNAKRLAKDKRVVAGAVTTLLLTVGVVVARKRNTVEDDVNETPEA